MDVAEVIRQRIADARAEGRELPARPDAGTMLAACNGDGYEALFWTLFYMAERDGRRRRRARRGAYHRWTEAEDRRILDGSLSASLLAAEIGVTASAVSTRRVYLRRSPYAPRVAA